MKFTSKNLLVTGGAGFIGSNFIEYFLNKYNDTNVINLDLLTYAGNLKNLEHVENNSRYSFVHGDICDKKLVKNIFSEYQIDGVINFAAESHVDNSIKNPEIFIKTNIIGVYNLLQTAYKYWMDGPSRIKKGYELARFHQISTDEVYGSIEEGSFSEKSNYNPSSPYSSSKASADMIVNSFNKTYGMNTTISISSNNFGPNQNNEKFLPKVLNCIINNTPIPVYGDGMNIRDWIYVKDHCRAVDLIFNKSISGQTYNIGGNNSFTNLDIINMVSEMLENLNESDIEYRKKIKFIDDRHGHDMRYSINSDKLKIDLNWHTEYKFEETLKIYLSSMLDKYQ